MKLPVVNQYNYIKLLQAIRERVPNYTPEWRFTPEYPDAGTALLMIFARMFEETVNRFNQVPYKNYLAFLNLLNADMAPALSAGGFVTFNLSQGAADGVLVRKGRQVYAESGEEGERIVFETQDDIFVTPAQIQSIYNVSASLDFLCDTGYPQLTGPDGAEEGFRLFDFQKTRNCQDHRLYIANENVLDTSSPAYIEVMLQNRLNRYMEEGICRRLSDPAHVDWLYYSDGNWLSFDEVSSSGNCVVLSKKNTNKIENAIVNERENRWLCCRVKDIGAVSHITLDGIKVKSRLIKDAGHGIPPERIMCNEMETERSNFYPFGERFSQYNTFYIGSDEVFSKKGAGISIEISIDFQKVKQEITLPGKDIKWKLIMDKAELRKPEEVEISIAQVSWEYWNGLGWKRLFVDPEYEAVFSRGVKTSRKISFICPDDFEKCYVNAQYGYWIKATAVKVLNPYAIPAYYMSPVVESLYLDYEYTGYIPEAEECIILNNMEYRDITGDVTGRDTRTVRPFYSFDDDRPAVYLGFDRPPSGSPLRLLFHLKAAGDSSMPALSWEYLKKAGTLDRWEPLKVIDKTEFFKYSGTVSFAGEKDFARKCIFNRDLYWIRVVNTDGSYDRIKNGLKLPEVKGIYMNTVEITQQETMGEEVFFIENGQQNKECILSRSPVLNEEVWVNEFGTLSSVEMHDLKNNPACSIEEVKDEAGLTREFWVKWSRVDSFLMSGENDRHYLINRHTGSIRFGDGVHGKIPPALDNESIRVGYTVGGGSKGNMPPNSINSLGAPIAFVDSVFNPLPTAGGYDRQTVEQAVELASKIIKHQNRAVTAEDYEVLAKNSSSNILKAKCIPNINVDGRKEPGTITVIIMPSTYELGQQYSTLLRRDVHRYLAERAPCTQNLRVIEPVYIRIAVSAEILVKDINIVTDVENACKEAITRFLNPITGNAGGRGWEIGEIPHIAKFYSLLKNVDGVYHIERIVLYAEKIEGDTVSEIDINDALGIPHAVPVSGKHRVNVLVANEL